MPFSNAAVTVDGATSPPSAGEAYRNSKIQGLIMRFLVIAAILLSCSSSCVLRFAD
jgi:hypothetical protein